MKKELVISIVLLVLVAGGIFWSMKPKPTSPQSEILPTNTPIVTTTISMEEVGKHNSPTDCWVIVNDNAYNVTDYANQHPAGPEVITKLCGKDATTAFMTRGDKGKHPQKASDKLSTMLMGTVQK